MKERFWLTPPEKYAELNAEFNFDFDPCPRPLDYNSLIIPWGKRNYVNPPFIKVDSPFGGPSAFARKAIAEMDKGNSSVFILPLPWSIALLMRAGAQVRYGGEVNWLEADTKQPCKTKRAQGVFILESKAACQNHSSQQSFAGSGQGFCPSPKLPEEPATSAN